MDPTSKEKRDAYPSVEVARLALSPGDLHDLCDATEAAIKGGGGFGWVDPPLREVLERYWQGVGTMPARILVLARLDGTVCGAVQLVRPPASNEAQKFACQLTGLFLAPWARGFGLSRMLMRRAEEVALDENFSVINLDVRETQDAAIGLYESLGYQLVGRHPVYARIQGKVVPGRVYYKIIDRTISS